MINQAIDCLKFEFFFRNLEAIKNICLSTKSENISLLVLIINEISII